MFQSSYSCFQVDIHVNMCFQPNNCVVNIDNILKLCFQVKIVTDFKGRLPSDFSCSSLTITRVSIWITRSPLLAIPTSILIGRLIMFPLYLQNRRTMPRLGSCPEKWTIKVWKSGRPNFSSVLHVCSFTFNWKWTV